mmetsp:Transcript_19822/g.67056  ORF Transcript_19822/g.67056 Transcript_19822/m.67056 type:complete len:335 (-) Transcript_19822:376-1380(-)
MLLRGSESPLGSPLLRRVIIGFDPAIVVQVIFFVHQRRPVGAFVLRLVVFRLGRLPALGEQLLFWWAQDKTFEQRDRVARDADGRGLRCRVVALAEQEAGPLHLDALTDALGERAGLPPARGEEAEEAGAGGPRRGVFDAQDIEHSAADVVLARRRAFGPLPHGPQVFGWKWRREFVHIDPCQNFHPEFLHGLRVGLALGQGFEAGNLEERVRVISDTDRDRVCLCIVVEINDVLGTQPEAQCNARRGHLAAQLESLTWRLHRRGPVARHRHRDDAAYLFKAHLWPKVSHKQPSFLLPEERAGRADVRVARERELVRRGEDADSARVFSPVLRR